ncbi:hypothetical protein A8709_04115 [Paenibacillus pectinilyticus]|uniref:Uncharacterized protein n=1 Tax=Paenibacillus pectinilyticus TaxID=512399 RepID=A0A1C0ZS60_9BACL|nr:hypothetical protein [Paenibacillus pectinilyticus]OCT10897.1 hypothetical protein A8709_04115 [Paenibacillus pectinilyticus]
MLKRKAIRIYVGNMIWFIPVLILIMGANPSVADSVWWKVLGCLLFAGIVVVCVWSWYQVTREKRETEEERYQRELVALRQFY